MLIHMILASAIQNSVCPMSFQPELIMASQPAGSDICAIEFMRRSRDPLLSADYPVGLSRYGRRTSPGWSGIGLN